MNAPFITVPFMQAIGGMQRWWWVAAAFVLLVGDPCAAGRLETLSRYDRLRTARVAPGPMPLTADFLARQRAEGFNAVALADVEQWDAVSRRWKRYDAESISRQLALARAFDMSVFVCIPGVEPLPSSPVGMMLATNDAAPRLEYVEDEALRVRVQLWSMHEQGEIIGAYFLGDDGFLLRVPAAQQLQWRAMAAEVAPQLPILGMIGEFGLTATEREREELFDPAAFDHVLWLNYPYNLGRIWGRVLDHLASSQPDAALAAYEHDYAAAMHERFFRQLAPRQLVVPVIQAFYYDGEPPGAIPRTRDIDLQARLVHYEMQTTLRQRDNYAMAYFYAGAGTKDDPFPVPKGIYDVHGWAEAVARQNALLEQSARLRLRARRPL